jgi:hypothetical protein
MTYDADEQRRQRDAQFHKLLRELKQPLPPEPPRRRTIWGMIRWMFWVLFACIGFAMLEPVLSAAIRHLLR